MKRVQNSAFISIFTATLVMGIAFPAALNAKPKLLPGESITVNKALRKKKLSQKPLAAGQKYSDSTEDADFLEKKYTFHTSTNWNCHDPKIFQDEDGTWYVYSTGWKHGIFVRSSKDLMAWTLHENSAFRDGVEVSPNYGPMHWDDEFLKWVGFETNDGTGYHTELYSPLPFPETWAPTVTKKNGRYYMFHGIIRDCQTSYGKIVPAACISLSIADKAEGPFVPASKYDPENYPTSTLVRYTWENDDETGNSAIGYPQCRNAGRSWESGFGAIDPEFVMDISTGELKEFTIGERKCIAMTYGSWKGGIALVYVDAETFRPVNQVTGELLEGALDSIGGNSGYHIAGGKGAAYEGSQLLYSSETGWYYLFVSMGNLEFDYRVGVGRSRSIKGPYLDASGQDMRFDMMAKARNYHAVGSKIIGGHKFGSDFGFTAPGGQSIFRSSDGKMIFASHARTDWLNPGQFCLQTREMFFNEEGWPLLEPCEYDGGQKEKLSMAQIAGTYEVVITKRNAEAEKADRIPQPSVKIEIKTDGTISGAYSGKILVSDGGRNCTVDLGKDGIFSGIIKASSNFALAKPDRKKLGTVNFSALNATDGSTNHGEYIWGIKSVN